MAGGNEKLWQWENFYYFDWEQKRSWKVFFLLWENSLKFPRREVSFEEGIKLAEANDLQFIETSAKTGENVEQAFGIATANVLRKIEIGEINPLSDVFKY